MTDQQNSILSRRGLLGATAGIAAAPLLGGMASPPTASPVSRAVAVPAPGKRKLGALDVSSVGIGVQNMSRTYQTTIPSRPEMFRIIYAAFDGGVPFFEDRKS